MLLVLAVLLSTHALADEAKSAKTEQPAESAQRTSPTLRRFAVVIGNNRSVGGRRPELHYADDDAARYFELLQTIAPGRTFLLSQFDRDTERLFPKAFPQAVLPTRAELERVGRQIATEVSAAQQAGAETEVHFIFAGHGDVAEGQGFIELSDARFGARDLEAWLRRIPFTRAHVILDSCNSFFMLGARKPGGRHFATPEDAARALSERLPNVGVFLSTSAEGETFEWSEIQSGIFSHVVRSGLLGAADANRDGRVSYFELSAFVHTATAEVPNPNMRPQVFARGPGAVNETAIVELRAMQGVRRLVLEDALPLRIRLRDANGLPLLDAHAERALDLSLPRDWVDGAVVERSPKTNARLPQNTPLNNYAMPPVEDVVTLAMLEPVPAQGMPRGPADTFQQLFSRPFGPLALAHYAAVEPSRPRPVFGVSREDTRRMQMVLDRISDAERGKRLTDGVGSLGFGVFVGALGADVLFGESDSKAYRWGLGGGLVAVGTLGVVAGVSSFGRRSPGEAISADFKRNLASGGDPLQAFAAADENLRKLVQDYEEERRAQAIFGGTASAVGVAALVLNEATATDADARSRRRLWSIGGLFISSMMLTDALTGETPSETLAEVWREDPSLIQYQPTLSVGQGEATVGLRGSWR